MYLSRHIDYELLEWKDDTLRKPLLLRGARQTGKTTAVRQFSKNFSHFIELNFEKDDRLAGIFNGDFNIARICAEIEACTQKPIIPGKTLLFLDEIQACPRAVSALRYFYEDKPDLHVIATGSLLEFVFSNIKDFGVGRIRNAYIYPFSFAEFADALGEQYLLAAGRNASFDAPIADSLHARFLDLLKTYFIVGGMPAAVDAYLRTNSFLKVQTVHRDILDSLKADFGKYSEKVPAALIRQAFASVINQTGGKFIYTDSKLQLSYRQSKSATELLELAKLIVRIDSCYANGVPLGGDINTKANKFMLLDMGLFMTESSFDLSQHISLPSVEFVNQGKLAEMFVGLELMKSGGAFQNRGLFYWHREAANSTAEVDYLVQYRNNILPIEVKSGNSGHMRSLGIMMKEKHLSLALRTSRENFSAYDNIRVIPLYLIGEWERILNP